MINWYHSNLFTFIQRSTSSCTHVLISLPVTTEYIRFLQWFQTIFAIPNATYCIVDLFIVSLKSSGDTDSLTRAQFY